MRVNVNGQEPTVSVRSGWGSARDRPRRYPAAADAMADLIGHIHKFTSLGPSARECLQRLATEWVADSSRPRVRADVLEHWRDLIRQWVTQPGAPLLVRTRGSRGAVITHTSGRLLVPTDNSPANWALASALLGRRPGIEHVRADLEEGRLPIAMVLKAAERASATYRGVLREHADPPNLNTLGWKVAHIAKVGLEDAAVESVPIASLLEHFERFMNPANMFLVPKLYAGLGEVPEFLEAFRRDSTASQMGV